jgi:hypothetical protein
MTIFASLMTFYLLHEAVIVKPKHIVLQKKRVLTKNFTVFIKFWRFNAFFDEAFTVTSRSKTIAALRLCVLDGNGIILTIVFLFKFQISS